MLKLYDQEVMSDKVAGTKGDCTRACVRTLMQDDMPDLPHPIDGDSWNDDFWDILDTVYGFDLKYQPNRPGKDLSFMPRVIAAGGPTVRTESTGATHMVVWDREAGVCIHDPHPSRDGLTSIDGYYWLEPS